VHFTEISLAAARWFLLANLVLAAWLYGGTRDWTREWVTWLLLANTGLFLIGSTCWRVLPKVPVVASSSVVFLLSLGGFMAWNARRQFLDSAGVFVNRNQPMPVWPGYWDVAMVLPSLWLAAGLLGAFCIACDMAVTPVWRRRLWFTLAGTGLSIVTLGLAQRFTGAQDIFWSLETFRGPTFFGVYRYHANAGAFINLVLPLQVGLAVRALRTEGAEAGRVLWCLGAFVTAAAGFVNVSKAANVICLFLILAMAVFFGANQFRSGGGRIWMAEGVSILVVVGVALSFGLEKTFDRWENLVGVWRSGATNSRLQAYEIIVRGPLPAAGWCGFGPGTFERVFDFYRESLGSQIVGRWDKAHSDALQTPMEWGWAGAVAWVILIGGGFFKALRAARGYSEDSLLAASAALALAGVMIHALMDFPLQIASLQLFTLVIVGLCWGLPKPRHQPLRHSKRNFESKIDMSGVDSNPSARFK
jgi:hypothetical protein